MLGWVGKQADRLQATWSVVSFVTGSTVTGCVFAWAAYASNWLAPWGPIGWVGAAACGVMAFLVASRILIWSAQAFWLFNYRRLQHKKAPDVDPLASHYEKKRIVLNDLMPPLPGELADKVFDNCDIIGPINVIPYGTGIFSSNYWSTDYIEISDEALNSGRVLNARKIRNCLFRNCRFYNVSFLVCESAYESFALDKAANWITDTKMIGNLIEHSSPNESRNTQ